MVVTEKTFVSEKPGSLSESDDQIEDAGRRLSKAEEVTQLSAIEDTAASTAAWLISVTVSLGGFLFGYAIPLYHGRYES